MRKRTRCALIIDSQRCKGCLLCIPVCPHGCLDIAQELNEKGYRPVFVRNAQACTGCGLCYQVCPDVCITVEKKSEE
ncbi:MAG: 4Fe-4S dicluster domain-containing protein [Elusimicrobia bacterium]|nr:4Fe-4S dicluster domain-containing protein [Elusimicrobiota bacterium]MBD3411786.1 4Fe-4S dicluster domain-containing protein [Elusimicrobiota bacterium]